MMSPHTLELEQLRRRCEEYRILAETSDAIPFRLTPDLQQFTYVGPQAERLLGIAMASWYAPGFFEARLPDDERVATVEQCRLVIEFGAEHEAEFRFRRDDGRWIWLRCAMRSFASSTGTVLAGHLIDITVRKTLAGDQAQSQKLEGIGRLAAGVAHEINTPAQYISDNITFVQEGLGDLLRLVDEYRRALAPAEQIRLAEREHACDFAYLVENMPDALVRASEGLARVTALVQSMKEFARSDRLAKVNVDLHHAIASTIVLCANEHRLVADVETDFGDIPELHCYASDLQQVFLNLIVNAGHAIADAVKAGGPRGKIRIATRVEGADVVIAISDTGTGMPVHVCERVFEPFFTTKEVGKGTGHGLSISRAIVEKHGGSLTFETAVGAGTTFFVRIPMQEEKS